jgi:hypothetical protein
MKPDTIPQIADHIAAQGDRWLFVALIIVGLFAIVVLWRWFTTELNKVNERVTDLTNQHIEMTRRISDVVANNTAALQNVHAALSSLIKKP